MLIDQADADGRTPLHWAAARGNSEAVRTLLEHGASPDKPDFILQGPLRSSMKADRPECMELLLQAELFIPALISWGADVNARDHSGQSLILEAVRNQHSAAVRILLHHGTLVGNPGDTVMTPLQVGIVNNAYDSVSELLTRRFNHAALDKTGMSVLHYAALFADVPMLSLLTRARMGGLNLGLRDEQGHTATELARQRTERQRAEMETKEAELEPIYWETAFAELLASVNMPRNSKMSMASRIFGSENSDSDDTTSFNSATEYLDELGFV